MLSILLLAALQAPDRVHQPAPVDPGIHGGVPARATAGDFTPDGRLLVSNRSYLANEGFRQGLMVSLVKPSLIDTSVEPGTSLAQPEFFQPTNENQNLGGSNLELYGSALAIESIQDSYFLYGAQVDDGSCQPEFLPTGMPMSSVLASELPLPSNTTGTGVNRITLTVRDLPGGNPFPSDASGNPVLEGTPIPLGNGFTTYELWMVMVDIPWIGGTGSCTPNIDDARLVRTELTVTIDEALQTIVSAELSAPPDADPGKVFAPLTVGGGTMDVRGIEPSMTADGRLILYHGDGGPNITTDGATTFIYNTGTYAAPDWTAPRSIVDMYYDYQGDADFQATYGLAQYPIQDPVPTGSSTYQPGEQLRSAYPWVSRDGSFFVATHTPVDGGGSQAGVFACGAITQGYLKHIDHPGINPTRMGEEIRWPDLSADPPQHVPANDFSWLNRLSKRQTMISTGLKPGIWQPFPNDVPVPILPADSRIPVLPLYVFTTDMYGEVRFEEADQNYLLYLACNESFTDATYPLIDSAFTPDTSGQLIRATAALTTGVAFPQDLSGLDLTAMRMSQGHENLGYKGQALAFCLDGLVSVSGTALGDYSDQLTVQAFVKVTRSWTGSLTLFDAPGFALRIDRFGRFVFYARLANGSGFFARSAFGEASVSALEDQTAGWRHVTVTFDGDDDGKARARMYLDGALVQSSQYFTTATLAGAGTATGLSIGPNRSGGCGSSVNAASAYLMMDEIAISSVVRDIEEIRRDAYVEPVPNGFTAHWSAGAMGPLPSGLSVADVSWPDDVPFVGTVAQPGTLPLKDIGQLLFSDDVLSWSETRSCADCHVPGVDTGFADLDVPLALDQAGNPLDFNTPTLWNMALGRHKFFDGRASNLKEQVLEPILSPDELGDATGTASSASVMAAALTRLNTGTLWTDRFGEPVTEDNLADALSVYVLSLTRGDAGAGLSPAAEAGRGLFFGKARCFACHDGPNFSDDQFHNVLSVEPQEVTAGIRERGLHTGRLSEQGMLKTPTLRGIRHTRPWFHDGRFTTLQAVVDHYNDGGSSTAVGTPDRSLRPLGLTQAEIDDLVAFLEAL